MPRGVADSYSIPFKMRLARVVLASLVRRQHDRLRRISRAKALGTSSLLTNRQASVLLKWYRAMKRDYASSRSIQGDDRVIEQLTGVVASEVAGWDRTVPLKEAFWIQFGKKEDPTKSQLDAFLNLPYAPAYLSSDRHPDDVRIEFDVFLARAWNLWLVEKVRQKPDDLDVLARHLAALAIARRNTPRHRPPGTSPQQLAAELKREHDEAAEKFGADLQSLESVPQPRDRIQCTSDIVERARTYAESLSADNIGPRQVESLIPDACYGLFGTPQEHPRLQDVIAHFERLVDSEDSWTSEALNTLTLASGVRAFDATQWIAMRGLQPLHLGAEITVSASMPSWLAQESRTEFMFDAPPDGCLWLTTTVHSTDSRMAAELAEAHLCRVVDMIAWMHRQPVITRTSAAITHDPQRKQILFPGFHTDERPSLNDQLGEIELTEAFKELERMSRDRRPFVRSVARGIAIWRKALQLDDLECRFVELWRAFEAIVGPFKLKSSAARNELHPLVLSKVRKEAEDTVIARYAVIMKLRNAWAIHPAEERRENSVEFVPQFQLRDICSWYQKDIWLLGTSVADLAMANPGAMTREDVAHIVSPGTDDGASEHGGPSGRLAALFRRFVGLFFRSRY